VHFHPYLKRKIFMTASLTPENLALPSPSDLQIKDILATLPRECFQKDRRKAWSMVVASIAMVGLGYWAIAASPWFLLPIAWIFTGTALTGFFVIGHDCGHRSFAKRKWVNDWVGHLFMAPLIYPFHCWRLLHDKHHNHTNKMDVDNAWQPFRTEFYESMNAGQQVGYRLMRGYFWWIGSILHWALIHFKLENYNPRDHQKVKVSIGVVVAFAAIAFPTLILTTGVWGFVKFWLMPWLVYHFWMSTFTIVHHTLPDIQFREPEDWNAAEAQLFGTVHCEYPGWVEFLCHHINVHIPHHLSTAIPSYNLRLAHESLQKTWGSQLQEHRFSWKLMRQIAELCHLYHPEYAYQSFKDYDQSKVMR
jgi:omega-6 fatty acid desaturase (delta-12 desaturase)